MAARDFPLGKVFDRWPEATLDLDRVVPTGDTVMPFFWLTVPDPTTDLAEVGAVLDDIDELRSASLMDVVEHRGLFKAEWKPEYMGIMAAVAAADLTVLRATGSLEGWSFELRAEHGDQLSEFKQFCQEENVDVRLVKLSRLSEMGSQNEYDLTPEQLEALTLAYREGYYDDPRETTIESLADQLGISRQAFSARLRRGYRNPITNTLINSEEPDSL